MKAIVVGLAIRWFKIQAAKAATFVLAPHCARNEIRNILLRYWKRYGKLRSEVPSQDTIGGSLMVSLAAMSTAFYQELTERGASEEKATQLFYDIAWRVYRKMGRFSWWLAGLGNRGKYSRLSKATRLFRAFPFSSPSYLWRDVKAETHVVGFDCLKCPVAEYFQTKGLSKFCTATWCALDYPLAEIWSAKLERSGSIASGAEVCDFRWASIPEIKKNIPKHVQS